MVHFEELYVFTYTWCNFYLLLCCSHIDFVTLTLLQAILLFSVSSKSCSYITRPDHKRREHGASGGRVTVTLLLTCSRSASVSFLLCLVQIQPSMASLLFYSILFCAGVGILLSPWPPALPRVISGIYQGVLGLTATLPVPLSSLSVAAIQFNGSPVFPATGSANQSFRHIRRHLEDRRKKMPFFFKLNRYM